MTPGTLDRVEVWSSHPFVAGSTMVAVLSAIDTASLTLRVGGELSGSLRVARGDPTAPDGSQSRALADKYSELRPGRWLRLRYTNELWHDVRILIADDKAGDGWATITLGGLSTWLAKSPPIALVTGGTTTFTFDGVGLDVTGHLSSYILPAATAIGVTFLSLGEVVPTAAVDVPYSNDTAWTGLQKLAEATGCEVSFRPDLSTDTVYLDLLPSDGSVLVEGGYQMSGGVAVLTNGLPTPLSTFGDLLTDPTGPRLAVGHNAAIDRRRSELEQRTVVYGAGEGGVTIAEATWVVADVDGDDLTLADIAGGAGPILVDGQLDGLYLEAADRSTRVEVTSSDADSQVVTVTSASAFSVGDRVRFRADAGGGKITSLSDPDMVAAHGVLSGVLSRSDIPETVNLVVNADQSTYTSGSGPADGWAAVGTPTLTRNDNAAHRVTGPYSCRVQTTADGDGYATPLVAVKLDANNPYVSGFLSFKIVSGRVRVELVATDGVDSWVFPDGTTQKAISTETGVWIQRGVAGLDLLGAGVTHVRLRVVQEGDAAAEFYVDAAQVTESAGQLPLVIGAGPTQLWQAVNNELAVSAPVRARYDGSLIDFHRIDPVIYPYHDLRLGAMHTVVDSSLGVVEGVRLLEATFNLLKEGETRVILSSLPSDLRSLRERIARPRRVAPNLSGQLIAQAAGARVIADLATTATDVAATSATAEFTEDDEGATLWVFGAGSGGAILKTTVAAVTSGTEIDMADAAVATLSQTTAILGTPEGVLTLAASISSGGGGSTADPDQLWQAIIDAQVRELARRLNEIDGGTGGGEPGEPGPPGPPGLGYEPTVIIANESGDPGVATEFELEAPAIGAILNVLTIPPSTVEIFGTANRDTPELSLAEGALHPIIPPTLVANRDNPIADKWYLSVTPTESSWEASGSHLIVFPEDPEEIWFSFPLGGAAFSHPGTTGASEWWYEGTPDDYKYGQWRVGLFEAAAGIQGNSSLPINVDKEVPSSATAIFLWGRLPTNYGDTEQEFHLILGKYGDTLNRTIAAELKREWNSLDEQHEVTVTLSYTNNSGTRTVLDSDTAVVSGNAELGFRFDLTRNSQSNYDLSAQVGSASIATQPDGSEIVTITSPVLTVSAVEVSVDNTNHALPSMRMVNMVGEGDNISDMTLEAFGMGWTSDPDSGDLFVAVTTMPIYLVDPELVAPEE